MADKHAPDYGMKPLHLSAYGNAYAEDYSIIDKPAANDKLYLGIIPAGIRVHAIQLIHGAAGVGATIKLGFEPVDPIGPTTDDDAFLAAGSAVHAAGVQGVGGQPLTFHSPGK